MHVWVELIWNLYKLHEPSLLSNNVSIVMQDSKNTNPDDAEDWKNGLCLYYIIY